MALRVVPLWPDFDPAADTHKAARLRARVRGAYADCGRLGLVCELREAVDEVTRRRAVTDGERAALLAWARYTRADAVTAWLATAAAEGWPHPGATY